MSEKPQELYHGSGFKLEGSLEPILDNSSPDHIHNQPAVFATERIDLAALFICPTEALFSIGFEQDIAYICIWGTPEEFKEKDKEGFIYVLPSDSFEKIGKSYEWQSFKEVTPKEIKSFSNSLDGMIENGVQVYFIDDNSIFDLIVENKTNRAPILQKLPSENERQNKDIKKFN
jgi:hypothetical protein